MKLKEININQVTTIIYIVVACIYFTNAGYSYLYKIEGEVFGNIGLGLMFLTLGIVFRTPKLEKVKDTEGDYLKE